MSLHRQREGLRRQFRPSNLEHPSRLPILHDAKTACLYLGLLGINGVPSMETPTFANTGMALRIEPTKNAPWTFG